MGGGVTACPDPKRPDFFQIEDDAQVFYVHVVKATGKVTLLAVWDREAESIEADAAVPAQETFPRAW